MLLQTARLEIRGASKETSPTRDLCVAMKSWSPVWRSCSFSKSFI
jgi:hypothetical protein